MSHRCETEAAIMVVRIELIFCVVHCGLQGAVYARLPPCDHSMVSYRIISLLVSLWLLIIMYPCLPAAIRPCLPTTAML